MTTLQDLVVGLLLLRYIVRGQVRWFRQLIRIFPVEVGKIGADRKHWAWVYLGILSYLN